ncbi:MAG: amino acid permease [Flavobacteriaceae bacterium]
MKKIGFWSSTALVTGNMIGSGIFLLPATLAYYGGISLLGWVCSSIGALLLAAVYKQLTKLHPQTLGGPYAFTKIALGNFMGYLVAWGYWVSIWCTNAAIAVAFVGYLGVFFSALTKSPVWAIGAGLSVLWFFTWVNSLQLKNVAWVQRLTTVLKLIPIFLIGFIGIWYIDFGNLNLINRSTESNFAALTATTTLTLFAYLGLESATITSAKVKNAAKTVGQAGLFGTSITIITYILCSVAIMGIIPPETLLLSTAPFADAAFVFWGLSSKYIVAAGAMLATLGALNGWILIQGQIPMAAAHDQLFPKFFKKKNKNGAPQQGIIVSSILASIVLMFRYSDRLVDTFAYMMNLSTLSVLTPFLLSALSLIVLQKRSKNDPHRGLIVIAVLAILFCVWVIFGTGFEVLLSGLLLLLVGILLYGLKHFWGS